MLSALPGVTTYNWVLQPDTAGTISGSGTNITVIWSPTFTGIATLKVAGENYCGTGAFSNPLTITVYLPNVTLAPFDPVSVNTTPFALTGGSPAGGTYSGPGVSNGMFDPAVAGVGTHTITYTYTDANSCTNSADQDIVVTQLTGINQYNDDMNVRIIPNPNTGRFILKLFTSEPVTLTIFNSMNEIVMEEKNVSTGLNYSKEIDLSDLSRGVYFLHVSGQQTNVVKKIIIQN